MTLSEIRAVPKNIFKNIVKYKMQTSAFNYLITKQKERNKGRFINYGNYLKIQDYLLPENELCLVRKENDFPTDVK